MHADFGSMNSIECNLIEKNLFSVHKRKNIFHKFPTSQHSACSRCKGARELKEFKAHILESQSVMSRAIESWVWFFALKWNLNAVDHFSWWSSSQFLFLATLFSFADRLAARWLSNFRSVLLIFWCTIKLFFVSLCSLFFHVAVALFLCFFFNFKHLKML